MDTKLLKQKILDLAIRGKLVPQDPNDEPVSVLLERIRAEKEKLIAEGKIKRPKTASDNRRYENLPFEIPESWEWVRLEDFVLAVTDGDHQPPPQEQHGVPFLVISDVNTGLINFGNARYVSQSYYDSLPFIRKAAKGDILFTVTGSYGIAINVDAQCDFCFQRHIGLIKTLQCSKWLFFVLQSRYVKHYCDNVATGTAQKTVSLGNLRTLLIPIPSLGEQTRIVAEIEQWFSLIDDLEKNKNDLQDAIRQVKFKILNLAVFGKLVAQNPGDEPASELLKMICPDTSACDNPRYGKLPTSWSVVTVGDVYNHTTGKALKKTNTAGVLRKYLTTSNLYWNSFDFTEVRSMYFTDKELEKCTAKKGDLLVCNGGDVGRAAIWNYEEDICIQNHISRLRPKYDAVVNNRFCCYVLMYLKQKDMLNGKGVAITSLSSADLLSVPIPLPPIREQGRIVQAIQDIENKLHVIIAEL